MVESIEVPYTIVLPLLINLCHGKGSLLFWWDSKTRSKPFPSSNHSHDPAKSH